MPIEYVSDIYATYIKYACKDYTHILDLPK